MDDVDANVNSPHSTVLVSHTVSFETIFKAKRQRQRCIVFKEIRGK